MKVLAFETSTECCSVALWVDGAVRARSEIAPRRHGELLLPWAEELLAESGVARSALDAVACSRGPGAFTGVRLGIAVAQGIALAIGCPLVAVSSLRVLAAPFLVDAAKAGAGVCTLLDARMGECYAAAWSAFALAVDPPRLDAADADVVAESLLEPAALPRMEGCWIIAGSGLAVAGVAERIAEGAASVLAAHADALPQAIDLVRIAAEAHARGEGVDAAAVVPVYLRNQVALTLEQRGVRRPTGDPISSA